MKIKAWEIKKEDMVVLPIFKLYEGVEAVSYHGAYVTLTFYRGFTVKMHENALVEVINF